MNAKTYPCVYECGNTVSFRSVSCGSGECVAKHNAAVLEYNAAKAAAGTARPRRPRGSRRPVMGEWGMAVMIGNPEARKLARS